MIVVRDVYSRRKALNLVNHHQTKPTMHSFFPSPLHSHKICCWSLISHCCQLYNRVLLYPTPVSTFMLCAGKALPLHLCLHLLWLYIQRIITYTSLQRDCNNETYNNNPQHIPSSENQTLRNVCASRPVLIKWTAYVWSLLH